MEKSSLGVRKGTWTKEEDILLKNCIDKYGEGKWHQVPLRAGLNRCRKSCRLRWLNYLRPDIKRGCFTKDELDLIIRLHKLLGNKWSLIAGRLPGRTANDVKNFWNTHVEKKLSFGDETTTCFNNNNKNNIICSTNTDNNNHRPKSFPNDNIIIRPRPRTFKNSLYINRPLENVKNDENTENKQKNYSDAASSSQEKADGSVKWWNKLLEFTENIESGNMMSLEDGKQLSSGLGDGRSSFSLEEFDVWELLNFEEH